MLFRPRCATPSSSLLADEHLFVVFGANPVNYGESRWKMEKKTDLGSCMNKKVTINQLWAIINITQDSLSQNLYLVCWSISVFGENSSNSETKLNYTYLAC